MPVVMNKGGQDGQGQSQDDSMPVIRRETFKKKRTKAPPSRARRAAQFGGVSLAIVLGLGVFGWFLYGLRPRKNHVVNATVNQTTAAALGRPGEAGKPQPGAGLIPPYPGQTARPGMRPRVHNVPQTAPPETTPAADNQDSGAGRSDDGMK